MTRDEAVKIRDSRRAAMDAAAQDGTCSLDELDALTLLYSVAQAALRDGHTEDGEVIE